MWPWVMGQDRSDVQNQRGVAVLDEIHPREHRQLAVVVASDDPVSDGGGGADQARCRQYSYLPLPLKVVAMQLAEKRGNAYGRQPRDQWRQPVHYPQAALQCHPAKLDNLRGGEKNDSTVI
ncbi:MAG: hypothetical protein ACRDTA_01490 [Pseudonocardiaceae bacterium]